MLTIYKHYLRLYISTDFPEREGKVQAGTKNPVYRQTEVSFKQLTDSNQSSVDDMAVLRGEPGRLRDRREDSMHQL